MKADGTAQLQEEEDELQMKTDGTAQLQEEEDELQMKGDGTAQLQEEEDELQMKADGTAQLQEEEDELQMKAKTPVQKMDDEELLQGKFESKNDIPSFGKSVAQAKSNTGMPVEVQAKMEKSFGTDFSNVKVHPNSSKASDIGAQAYAQGSDIHMAPGKYDPNSQSGQELLGHELTHVVQQREGRVKATTQAKGIPVNDDQGLEKEADNFGAIAARGGIVQQNANTSNFGSFAAAQMKVAQLTLGDEAEVINADDYDEYDEDYYDEDDDEMLGEEDVPIPPFPTYSADAEDEGASPAPPMPKGPRPALPPRPPQMLGAAQEAEEIDVDAYLAAQHDAEQGASPAPPLPKGPRPAIPPKPAHMQGGGAVMDAAQEEEASPALPLPKGPRPAVPPRPKRIKPRGDQEVSPHSGAARTNYNDDGAQDYSEYGVVGAGGAATAASTTTKTLQVGDAIGQGGNLGKMATGEQSKFSEFGGTADAVSGLGIAAGGLGVIGAGADAVRAGQIMNDSDKVGEDRVKEGGGAMLSATASGVKNSANSAYHASNLAGNAGAAAGAVAAVGIGSVVMGTADIARGAHAHKKANQRGDALRGQEAASGNKDVQSAAHQAASTQDMRKAHAKGTVFKGLLLVAGGSALIILGSNPIGWGLLAGAAIVGGIASLRRFLAKKARKKDVAIRELGVTDAYEAYKAKKKAAANRKEKKRITKEENPLSDAMVTAGYKATEYGKFYADYIHDTAWVLYNCGVLGDQQYPVNQQMRELIVNMGLKVVANKSPLPDKIAKNLHK